MDRSLRFQYRWIHRANTRPTVSLFIHRTLQEHQEVDIAITSRIAASLRTIEDRSSQPFSEGRTKCSFQLLARWWRYHSHVAIPKNTTVFHPNLTLPAALGAGLLHLTEGLQGVVIRVVVMVVIVIVIVTVIVVGFLLFRFDDLVAG